MALIAVHHNAGVILVVTVYNIPLPPTSIPSLISLMVSVDVKHHVYLVNQMTKQTLNTKHIVH